MSRPPFPGPRTVYTLAEYEPLALPPTALSDQAAAALWQRYRSQVEVEPPSFKTDGQWRLTAQGWAGYLPVTRSLGLLLQPKVALRDLFGMLEVAYDLGSFQVLAGRFRVESLPGLYERLALILARRVLARARQGFYRTYLDQTGRITPLRGRLKLGEMARRPFTPALPCAYQELTADVAENRILTWTLHTILRSGVCGARSRATLQRAYRLAAAQTTLTPLPAEACRGRSYSRLNEDYRPLHALCAFFLDANGPGHRVGEQEMVPFMVDMERLFERFVAAWLGRALGEPYRVAAQVRTPVGSSAGVHFAMDVVVSDAQARPRWVIDTKYKLPERGPDPADVAQILAYAQVQGAPEAVLVYPAALRQPLDTWVNGIRVRTLDFALDGHLDAAGEQLIRALTAKSAEDAKSREGKQKEVSPQSRKARRGQ